MSGSRDRRIDRQALEKKSISQLVVPLIALRADILVVCRVSGAVSRTKVSEERTRGPRMMVYGYFCLRLRVGSARPAAGRAGRDVNCLHCRRIRWLCRWADIERLFRHVVIARRRDGE